MLYLDNAATSHPKPEDVYLAVDSVFRQPGSASRGTHQASLAADQLVFETRELLAQFFNVPDSDRFVFTFNATMAINQALFGLLKSGDRVVTTSMEHNAVSRPLRALSDQGIEVVKVKADNRSGIVDPDELRQECVKKQTRLLVVNHCSNVFGSIQDITGLGDWCRQHNVIFMLDASQSAGMLPIDITSSGIDLLAAPGHKGLLGPQGTGFLYVGENLELTPFMYGGTGANSHSDRQPDSLPERFESGTYNLAGLAGLKAGIEFVLQTGIETIRSKEKSLVGQLISGLNAIDGVVVYGPQDMNRRGAAISFSMVGKDPSEIGYLLDQQNIAVRVGLHCAPDAHHTMGTYPAGTVRVSPGFFTTNDDIACFISVINTISQDKH